MAGVVGRKGGTEPGYDHLSAMRGEPHLRRKTLAEYLHGPGKFVPGERTVYFVPDEKDRLDVIAYLKTPPKE